MSKESALNKEQRKVWQKNLALAIIKERRGNELNYIEKTCLEWLKRYRKLMGEKLDILQKISDREKGQK